MPTRQRLLGSRLRAERNRLGLTARQLADRLQSVGADASHTTILQVEKGRQKPAFSLVEAWAKVLKISIDELQRDHWIPFAGVQYRAKKTTTKRLRSQFEDDAHRWLCLYLELERLLRRPLRDSEFISTPTEDGRVLAERLRDEYGFDSFPIPSVSRMLENFGIRAISLPAPDGVDAMAARLGSTPVVALNSAVTDDRLRLTMAHELGHHLLEDCDDSASLDPRTIEERAFSFASHLLLPDQMLREAFETKSMVRLIRYKERFGISLAAMVFRARRASLITQSEYRRLWVEFSRLGWKTNEPGTVAPDRPYRLEFLMELTERHADIDLGSLGSEFEIETASLEERRLNALGAYRPDDSVVSTGSLRISDYIEND